MSREPLHVLMTTDAVGGVFNHTVTLGRQLVALGCEVSVAVLGPPAAADQLVQLRTLPPHAIREFDLKLEWMPEPWDDIARAENQLLELERELRPDVIHAGSYFCGRTGFTAPVVVVAHSCVCSWWQAVLGCDPPPEWRRYRRLVSAGLAGADAVVAPSRTMLAALQRNYGTLPPRSLTILNGIAASERQARKESFVLAAGRMWDPAKNLEALTAVAADLPRPVLVAGDAPSPPAQAGLEHAPLPNVHLLGRLSGSELGRIRRRAPVFAAPARYEPFGLSILEAAGDRCALVLGDIPSLRELWDGAAVFIDPEDHDALGTALIELLARPERAWQLGRDGRLRAEQLSAAPMAAAYCELYRELTRRPAVIA